MVSHLPPVSAPQVHPGDTAITLSPPVRHPSDPYLVQASHAAGVDAGEYFDAMPGPLGDVGGGHARVEPPGDAGVPQVIRPFHQRRGELFRGEGQVPDLLPDLPPGGRLDRAAALAAE